MNPAGTVHLTVTENVALITLHRPEVRNAVDRPTADALALALDTVDERDDIRAAVLAGTANVFSAGMDLKAFSMTGERPINDRRGPFGIVARPPHKPLIAASKARRWAEGSKSPWPVISSWPAATRSSDSLKSSAACGCRDVSHRSSPRK